MKKYLFILLFVHSLIQPCNLVAQNKKVINNEAINLIQELRNSQSSFKTKKAIKKIEKSNISYDSLVKLINLNNYYSSKSATGYNVWHYTLDSLNYACIVIVPTNYSSEKRYPVSVILHGAVMSLNPEAVTNHIKKGSYNTDSLGQIIVYPAGWFQSPWWSEKQIHNLNYILRRLKQNYNIDENAISLAGISDGGTGVVYQAGFNITPWSNFRAYISNPAGLSDLSNNTLYLKNLSNKPFLFISSEKDPLFPPHYIETFLGELNKTGCDYNFYLAKGFKHEISWLPIYEDTISNFIKHNRREPYPTKVFWQTDNLNYNRNHWVIIDKLSNNEKLSLEEYPIIKNKESGFNKPPGIIYVESENNAINVKTINIKQYTLLLSPEQLDFNNPIEVYTNGELSFKGKISKDIHTLLHWFNISLDRTMLYGYALKIKVN